MMQFVAHPPDAIYEKFMGDRAWRIFATGEIDADADKRLAALIASKNIPQYSKLYLHSPGGNLAGGMALGRVIRENRLHTFIGQFDPNQKFVGGKPGSCYSACAIAFLGGEFRYWTNGSVYGVHRFFWKGRSDNDADVAQIEQISWYPHPSTTVSGLLCSEISATEFWRELCLGAPPISDGLDVPIAV